MASILEALADTAPPADAGRCKLGRWLDSIPADEPGRDELADAFNAPSRTGRTHAQLAAVAARLGEPLSVRTISAHRSGACRCSW